MTTSAESLRSASSQMVLTSGQRALLRKALESGAETRSDRSDKRAPIHELCSSIRDWGQGPEQLLIGFKGSLIEAANEARIPHGPDRTALLAGVVSVFIEELYGFRARDVPSRDDGPGQQL